MRAHGVDLSIMRSYWVIYIEGKHTKLKELTFMSICAEQPGENLEQHVYSVGRNYSLS